MVLRRTVVAAVILLSSLAAAGTASGDPGKRRTLTTKAYGAPVVAAGGHGTTAVAWPARDGLHVRVFRGGRERFVRPIREDGARVSGLQVTVGGAGETALTWFAETGEDECDNSGAAEWRVAVLPPGRRRFTAPRRLTGPGCDIDVTEPRFMRDGRLLAVWSFNVVNSAIVDRGGVVRGRRSVRPPSDYTQLLGIDVAGRRPRLLISHDLPDFETYALRFLRLSGPKRAERRLRQRKDFNGGLLPAFDAGGLGTFLWNNNEDSLFAFRRIAGRLHRQRLGPRAEIFEESLASRPSGATLAAWRAARVAGATFLEIAYAAPERRFSPPRTLLRERYGPLVAPAAALGPDGAGVVAVRTKDGARLRYWRLAGDRVVSVANRRAVRETSCDEECAPDAAVDGRAVATIAWLERSRVHLIRSWPSTP